MAIADEDWDLEKYFWPKDRVEAWRAEGWDRESLKKKPCPHPDYETYYDYWDNKVEFKSRSSGHVVREFSAWDREWWIQFPKKSGKYYSPYHLPLFDIDTGDLSPKHPDYIGPDAWTDEMRSWLHEGLVYRAGKGGPTSSHGHASKHGSSDLQPWGIKEDWRAPIVGVVLPSSLKLEASGMDVARLSATLQGLCIADSLELRSLEIIGFIDLSSSLIGKDVLLSDLNYSESIRLGGWIGGDLRCANSKFVSYLSLDRLEAKSVIFSNIGRLGDNSSGRPGQLLVDTCNFRSFEIVGSDFIEVLCKHTSFENKFDVHRSVVHGQCRVIRSVFQTTCRLNRSTVMRCEFKTCDFLGSAQIRRCELDDLAIIDSKLLKDCDLSLSSVMRRLDLTDTFFRRVPDVFEFSCSADISFERASFPIVRGAPYGPLKNPFILDKYPTLIENKINDPGQSFDFADEEVEVQDAEEPSYYSMERSYGAWKRLLETHQSSQAAIDFFVRELDARIRKKEIQEWERWLGAAFRHVSAFGTKIGRPLRYLLLWVPLFFLAWYLGLVVFFAPGSSSDVFEHWQDFAIFIWEPSLNPLAGFEPENVPPLAPLWSSMPVVLVGLTAINRLLNITLLFLVGLAIRRRFQIS